MRERLREALARYEPQALERDPALWPAAVLVLLYESGGRAHIVFQKRTDKVDAHKGQISFPGGGADPEDTDLLSTALRETHEEIGVLPEDVEVLGRLDDIKTISNFLVTPYVGWLARYPYEWRFSDDEVAYLLEVPIEHLLEPANFIPDRRVVNGREFVMPSYQFEPDLIWGATARMLSNFLDLYIAATGAGGPAETGKRPSLLP
ncbi:MAG: CoA pyrophosphatase [Chloroflexi bacterium]|nr:CoA pyrophosphatase [Chloroflexota bacterium]